MEDLRTLPLTDGVRIGETVYRTLELRPLTAGDAIDAGEAAETVRLAIDGDPVVVASPTRATAERLRRNVKRAVGDDGKSVNGPLSMAALRAMSEPDYLALVQRSEALDQAYLAREGVAAGRSDSAAAGDDPDGRGAE